MAKHSPGRDDSRLSDTQESPRFTPGPWCRRGHHHIATVAFAGLPVCEVLPGGVGGEQAIANGNLIIAAPDLYAALQAIVTECDVVAEILGKDLIPNGLLVQAREALKGAREGL